MSKFSEIVYKIVSDIPKGYVASYGQVAALAGAPRAAREVGWCLNKYHGMDLPWWRVVNSKGKITIKGSEYDANFQKKLLIADGVEVDEEFNLDINKYRWNPKNYNPFS
jgi:methylated-DNA-protein-cysteine methyltransferase-like protein